MHFNGLQPNQVEESRKKYGSNVIPDSEPTTFWAEFKETFKDPMIRILLAIAALMIVMCAFGYADIYEPLGTIVAVLIVAFVSAKTGVASDTKYRQLKDSTKKDQCKVYRRRRCGRHRCGRRGGGGQGPAPVRRQDPGGRRAHRTAQ